jgi:predicted negative regulator of RcsB-dependent stress response
MGKFAEAKQAYEQALKMTLDSSQSKEIKDNAALFQHFNLARIAIEQKDLVSAKKESEEFRKGADLAKNSNLIKQAHELAGRIALQEKNYEAAISELAQSNQQNPAVLYLTGEAYQAKGDAAKAKDSFTKAAKFNSLPALNYAFIRAKAEKAIAT